jgi:hypothetical protein
MWFSLAGVNQRTGCYQHCSVWDVGYLLEPSGDVSPVRKEGRYYGQQPSRCASCGVWGSVEQFSYAH